MERSHGREFKTMSGAPVKKLPASSRVSLAGVSVADRGGEKINVGFRDFWAGSELCFTLPSGRENYIVLSNWAFFSEIVDRLHSPLQRAAHSLKTWNSSGQRPDESARPTITFPFG